MPIWNIWISECDKQPSRRTVGKFTRGEWNHWKLFFRCYCCCCCCHSEQCASRVEWRQQHIKFIFSHLYFILDAKNLCTCTPFCWCLASGDLLHCISSPPKAYRLIPCIRRAFIVVEGIHHIHTYIRHRPIQFRKTKRIRIASLCILKQKKKLFLFVFRSVIGKAYVFHSTSFFSSHFSFCR